MLLSCRAVYISYLECMYCKGLCGLTIVWPTLGQFCWTIAAFLQDSVIVLCKNLNVAVFLRAGKVQESEVFLKDF